MELERVSESYILIRKQRERMGLAWTFETSKDVELNGQAGAKPFLLGRDYCPGQPDSIPHDLRLLSNISHLRKGKKKGEGVAVFFSGEVLPTRG